MHDARQKGSKKPLLAAAAVILAYLGVEVTGAVVSGSLALLADAAHTVSDLGALGLALMASWMATRPVSGRRSFGYLRAEVLAALTNGGLLLAVAVFIFVEAGQRIGSPPNVQGGIVSLVASGGLAANLVAGLILMRSSRVDLNTRAALFHVGGDALGSMGAIAGGLLIVAFGWNMADPIVSIFIGLVLVYGALHVVAESAHVLLEGTPAHIDTAALHADIERLEHVQACHDLHTWTITSGYDALSAHVIVRDECTEPDMRVLQERLHEMVIERYGIAHVTIQLERGDGECEEEGHIPEIVSGTRRA